MYLLVFHLQSIPRIQSFISLVPSAFLCWPSLSLVKSRAIGFLSDLASTTIPSKLHENGHFKNNTHDAFQGDRIFWLDLLILPEKRSEAFLSPAPLSSRSRTSGLLFLRHPAAFRFLLHHLPTTPFRTTQTRKRPSSTTTATGSQDG